MKIDEDTLDRTKFCEKRFSCLSGEKKYLCEVKFCNICNTLFINPNDRDCNYYIPYGNSFLCFCPTRNEIYKRYKI
jgi:hypothetical protein